MEKYTYRTNGTCARQINFELDGGIVTKIEFIGGCPGNLIGLTKLIEGQPVDELIEQLKGIQCRNQTSCPDQFAQALEAVKLELAKNA